MCEPLIEKHAISTELCNVNREKHRHKSHRVCRRDREPSRIPIRSLKRLRNNSRKNAAIYLKEGKNNNRFETHPTSQTLRWYLLANSQKFYVLELMAALILLALGLTEKPRAQKANNLSVPVEVHAAVEILSLMIVLAGRAVKLKWQGTKFFFSHKRTLFTVVIWCVVFAEAIVVLVRRENHFRVTRSLRPLFLIDTHYCSGVRRVLRQILLSLPPILYMLFLLFFIMVIFAMLGFYLFSDNEKDEFFSSFGGSFISLFVLITTANYPDVMMPAYIRSRWSVIYFAVYIAVVLYFLMGLGRYKKSLRTSQR